MEIDNEESRIRALLVNEGTYTLEEAQAKILAGHIQIRASADILHTIAGQAAFLTAVATAVRCFGRVDIAGVADNGLLIKMPCAQSVIEAAKYFGAYVCDESAARSVILFGDVSLRAGESGVRAFWNGWCAGVAPANSKPNIGNGRQSLAGVAAGAMAVGLAFQAELGDLRATTKSQSLSLWTLQPGFEDAGPDVVYLPDKLWLIGLGNLGQAYLWSLSWLSYRNPQDLLLFLQDDDVIKRENWGTSILVKRDCYGMPKGYVAEQWAAQKGFQVRRIDRKMDSLLRRNDSDPPIALAGLDRISARKLLDYPQFKYVIDAGLGGTARDYSKFAINIFHAGRAATTHYEGMRDNNDSVAEELRKLPAYQEYEKRDACGAAILRGQNVAVPFVSAFVGALAITSAIQISSQVRSFMMLKGELGDLRNFTSLLDDGVKANDIGHAQINENRGF